jgi:hypothetical protein
MNKSILKFCIISVVLLAGAVRSFSQEGLPEVFKEETISEQLKYLEEKTRIYENYRAVREDMFRAISRNTNDTLKSAKSRINGLILQTTALNNRIDSLKNSLEVIQTELSEMTSTKNSISVLGLEVNKVTYNSIMWTIMAVLVFLLAVGFLTFKQNRAVTLRTKKDLNELKEEFEEYQKKTRIERERMSIDHFNEIKKLKGG